MKKFITCFLIHASSCLHFGFEYLRNMFPFYLFIYFLSLKKPIFDMSPKQAQGTIVNKLHNQFLVIHGLDSQVKVEKAKCNLELNKATIEKATQVETRSKHPLNYSNIGFSRPNLDNESTL